MHHTGTYLQNIKLSNMVNTDLRSFISFLIRCASSHSPLYLAAQMLRIDFREFGEEAIRILIATCPSVDFLYICSGLSIIRYRIPFVREVISHVVLSMTPEEQSMPFIVDNIYLLGSCGLHNAETHTNSRMQALIHRSSSLLDLTAMLAAPYTVTSAPLRPIDDWACLRNTLLRLPPEYFDEKRALDPTYDPFTYLVMHQVHIDAISPSASKTCPSFASLLLSSLSLSDFTHKVSALKSQDIRKQLILQALGDINSYTNIDFSPDVWRSVRDCSLYSQALQKLLQIGWASSVVDAFVELYRDSATRCLSDIRRTAEACGDIFRHTTDYSVQGQLVSFIDLREDVCILQRRVFLRFFVLAASPSKVDAAIVRLLGGEGVVKELAHIPNTSFSRKLLKNLALRFAYMALLEPLE